MAGVDAVIGKGYIDTSRMYVSGCSGGGVLSSWVIGHTDRFAAAAVRCPVIELDEHGRPDRRPAVHLQLLQEAVLGGSAGLAGALVADDVGKVTTPTLLMTGVLDRRTPMPQTEEYYAALKMQRRAGDAAAVQRRVPRHRLEAVELHPHAALHDELVQGVPRGRPAAGCRATAAQP